MSNTVSKYIARVVFIVAAMIFVMKSYAQDSMEISAADTTTTVSFIPPPRVLGAFLADSANVDATMVGQARTYNGVTRYWLAYSNVADFFAIYPPEHATSSTIWSFSENRFIVTGSGYVNANAAWTYAQKILHVDTETSSAAYFYTNSDETGLMFQTITTFSDEYTKENLKSNFEAKTYQYSGTYEPIDNRAAYRRFASDGTYYGVCKLKYKIKPLAGYYGPIYWMEVFTPDEDYTTPMLESDNKEYRFMSWQVLPGATEFPEYTIDPLDSANYFHHSTVNGTYTVQMVDLGLAVDANRDGKINLASQDDSDVTSSDKPFRFWINDDNDVDTTTPGDAENVAIKNKNCDDGLINGIRDLEDFSRLKINLGGLQDAVLQGQIQVGLKWKATPESTGSPSIKVWYNFSPNGGTKYLTDVTVANQHLVLRYPGLVDGTTPYIIPTKYWQDVGLSASQPCGNLLFEGCTVGKGQLVITLRKADGTEIGEGPGVWLDLKSIKSMYEGPGTTFEKPADETPQGIVFVHGWNMSPEGATSFSETMFKRLWHRGFKGRFVSIRWNTNYSDAFDNVPLVGEAIEGYLADYNGSERVAWQSGAIVKAAVDGLPAGYSRNIIAHSMGNIVAGSALLSGVTFDNYVLMQAAVPASCYDDRDILKQAERLSPDSYAGFHPTFWEADASPDDDIVAETRAMSYRGRLSSTTGNLVSFYLTNDHATTYAWEFNNDQTKPIPNYGYTRGAPATLGAQRALWRQIGMGPFAYHDSLTDPFIAMPFVCRSWSKVVGAESRTAGSIKSSFNLNSSPSFFDTEHSAQFNRSVQVLKPFYDELLRRLQITPNP